MKKYYCIVFLCTFSFVKSQSHFSIYGKIIDNYKNTGLEHVKIKIESTEAITYSKTDGSFVLPNLLAAEYTISFSLTGYETIKMPLKIVHSNLHLENIRLTETTNKNQQFIYLNDIDLQEESAGETNSISGILVATKDVFLKTVAYDFSSTFFRPRGLEMSHAQVMINGVKMNKLFNGRPQWSNWGGLNDVLRNQEYTLNLAVSNNTFGLFGSSTNIITQASTYRKGVKISYASSNRSYKGRLMASYNSGLLQNGWAYTFSASKRYANEGFREGTLYDANSFFTAAEKIFNTKHRLGFTAVYAANTKGKSSPNTQEVYDLKSIKYNAYWGNQENNIRNSRIKKIIEPILQFNHQWNINTTTSLQTSVTYQFGKVGNSRLDYGGGRLIDNHSIQNIIGGGVNPDPTYYQKLPSYFLRDTNNPDYENAYLAEQEFLNNGQINWNDLYQENLNLTKQNNSIYALYEDRNDDNQLTLNTVLYKKINPNFTFNTALTYTQLQSENFAYMLDLLGGNGFLDVDIYADNIHEAQSDLQNPNRIVVENEKFKYHYNFDTTVINGFIQGQYTAKKIDAFLAANFTNTTYQRTGFYENGAYPENRSLGKSKTLHFSNFSVKSGVTYKISGRHLLTANTALMSLSPTLQNSFSNARENNDIVIGLTDEKLFMADISYYLRHPNINMKFTAYGLTMKDQTDISFYFADGLVGLETAENTAFVQEVLTGIDKQNIGVEIGIEVPLIKTIQLKAVAAIGQSVYTNNPNLYLTSDGFTKPKAYEEVALNNYFVSGGPQQAYSIGFDYNNPNYWWFGTTINYFKNAYVDIAPITRTKNFYLDEDGLPINNYDPSIARELLKQEKFDAYFLVNLVGGKSWKINTSYFGFFLNIGNVLNTKYKTGGFEQSRNANYNTLLEDQSRNKPLFGPKYWFGYGTSYYASVYLRL